MPAPSRPVRRGSCRARRAFTLLEALMASAILVGIVTAVTSGIIAGQQHSLEAQNKIAGALAAEALLGRIITEDYDSIANWNGFHESAGDMVDEYGTALPGQFDGVGRTVTVVSTVKDLEDIDVVVKGRTITVRAFDYDSRTLVELSRFVAEPQS